MGMEKFEAMIQELCSFSIDITIIFQIIMKRFKFRRRCNRISKSRLTDLWSMLKSIVI